MTPRRAEVEPGWVAQIVARRPMRYRLGADAALDRPAHVRAASGLAWLGTRLVVVQDDAAFLGVVDPHTGLVDDVPLPSTNGRRVFGKTLGNKADKPDLESVFADGELLIAFGSGGPLPSRRVAVTWREGESPSVVGIGRLLDELARVVLPGATALNLEGATRVGGEVWLANRGGDVANPDVSPDAVVTVELRALRAFLTAPDTAPLPSLGATPYDLGALDGCALHFTELESAADGVWYLGAAEATASCFDDGQVMGSVLGHIGQAVRYAVVLDEKGRPSADKLEGLAVAAPGRFFAVVDADDPDRPADLLELTLT